MHVVAVLWQFIRQPLPAFPVGQPARHELSVSLHVVAQLFAVDVQGSVHAAASLESGGFASTGGAESRVEESTMLPVSFGGGASVGGTEVSMPFIDASAPGPAPSGAEPSSPPPVYVNWPKS
jgi:hypothetical protein